MTVPSVCMTQIEISKTYGPNEWHDDLRKVMRLAGEANKKVWTMLHSVVAVKRT